jgi:hypothetical protein
MSTAGQWRKPEGDLARLDRQHLGRYQLEVLQGPRNAFGAIYFSVAVTRSPGEATEPALLGLLGRGPYPAHNWLEVLHFRPGDLDKEGLILPLFLRLSALVPPGGHMMVEYESPFWASTREALALGVPPVLTPLGQVLREAGCERVRDWHIAEGGVGRPEEAHRLQVLRCADQLLQARRAGEGAPGVPGPPPGQSPGGGTRKSPADA